MQRLLNGDVGSGKTVVAGIAATNVARAGFQAAYLAPTEVLAVQQAAVLHRWLAPLGIRVACWTRTARWLDGRDAELRALKKAVRDGNAQVIVGTHAILSSSVRFHRLGLAVVDEQHRFGVAQRAALRQKTDYRLPTTDYSDDTAVDGRQSTVVNCMPHLLSMTATPIPRTLALSLLGDLRVSVLDELPAHRTAVATRVVPPHARAEVARAIRAEVAAGHQAFVVCPKIDAEEGSDAANVTERFERVRRAFPDLAVGLLHGRLSSTAQQRVITDFVERRIAMLVATTIIEVGVDCPNATVMVIEDAERFGLAQLHQLRGRVGRGDASGTCFLASSSSAPAMVHRLERVASCTDGFKLAEIDLQERGPGAIVGTAQSGWPEFRFATMDPVWMRRAQAVAEELHDTAAVVGVAHLE